MVVEGERTYDNFPVRQRDLDYRLYLEPFHQAAVDPLADHDGPVAAGFQAGELNFHGGETLADYVGRDSLGIANHPLLLLQEINNSRVGADCPGCLSENPVHNRGEIEGEVDDLIDVIQCVA